MPITCPICGEEGYVERRSVGRSVYLYAVHYYVSSGRSRVYKCYLGPEEPYKYVDRFYRLGLSGIATMNSQRLLEALERMLAIVEAKIERDRKMMKQAIDILNRSLKRLRKEHEALQSNIS
jgi:hypothetical protein